MQGRNMIWEVMVQEGRWARADYSAHTHCSSQRLELADLCVCLTPSVSLFKHLTYYFSLPEYSLLSCDSYSSIVSVFLLNITRLKIIHTRKIDRYLTYNTAFDSRGLFQDVPTENHFDSIFFSYCFSFLNYRLEKYWYTEALCQNYINKIWVRFIVLNIFFKASKIKENVMNYKTQG